MSVEVESDYQKSSWLKSLFRAVKVQGHEANLGFWGLQNTPQKLFWDFSGSPGMLPWKILKMEPLRLAKNTFPAYSYGHEVS